MFRNCIISWKSGVFLVEIEVFGFDVGLGFFLNNAKMTQGARAESHLMHMYMEAAFIGAIGNNCKSKINQT